MRECINAHTELLKIFENFSHCQKFFAFEKLGNFSLLAFFYLAGYIVIVNIFH